MPRSSIGSFETGDQGLPEEYLKTLARYFKTTPSELSEPLEEPGEDALACETSPSGVVLGDDGESDRDAVAIADLFSLEVIVSKLVEVLSGDKPLGFKIEKAHSLVRAYELRFIDETRKDKAEK